jgi:hypothetical protein
LKYGLCIGLQASSSRYGGGPDETKLDHGIDHAVGLDRCDDQLARLASAVPLTALPSRLPQQAERERQHDGYAASERGESR